MRRYHITHHVPRLMTPSVRMLLRVLDKIGFKRSLSWTICRRVLGKKGILLIVFGLSISPLLASSQTHYKASPVAYQMIKKWEGFYPYTYLDAGGLPTISFGHLIRKGEIIKEPIQGNGADALLISDVGLTIKHLNSGILRNGLRANQFDSICDWSFNLGTNAFIHSTLRKKINQNASNDEITQEFLRWNKVGNRPFKGLTKRRMAEARLYVQ